ncbi:hypothetical protein SAMN04489812_4658 [Microlunatus soli]|uniref:Uncharacterized protein n=2 Tax=Microlunatus soli TaxID=630515 RepID=A0A1H1YLM2_9ACTN|nr:hypothetical protein SAMN04489812_4658 [Microlunatus soli]
MKYCSDQAQASTPTSYPASTDKTWQYTDYSGCVVTYAPTSSATHNIQTYQAFVSKFFDGPFSYWKVSIDNTKGSETCSAGEPSVVTEDQEQVEFQGIQFWLDGDPEEIPADDDYSDFLEVNDKLIGDTEVLPGAKGKSYTVYRGELKPFVSMYINDAPAEQVDKASDTSDEEPAESASAKALDSKTFEHFKVSLLDEKKSGALYGAEVETCVVKLGPDPQGNKTRVSRDPWSFAYGTQGAGVPANTVDPLGTFGKVLPAESLLAEDECVSGWLTYDTSGNGFPEGMLYSNSYGEQATFTERATPFR